MTAVARGETCRGVGNGKLMIAGEYAVTCSRRRALVVAVDRHVTAVASDAPGSSVTVTSTSRDDAIGADSLGSAAQVTRHITRENAYALRIIAKAEALARGRGTPLRHGIKISIASDLDGPSGGVKLGLGGSSAVTAALAAALNDLLALGLDRKGLWKLSYLATIETNPRASGADLAAAVYGGWLCYRSPDREWLDDRLDRPDLVALIDEDWPGLDIETLDRPRRAGPLAVGWSGTAAVTADLVATVTPRLTTEFLDRSDDTVERLATALSTADQAATARYVARAQSLIEDLDTPALGIMTDPLRAMLSASAGVGVPSKISGAGGGDCCIAFPAGPQEHAALRHRWESSGFRVLPLRTVPHAEEPA